MGKRGPKPKSTADKILAGNPGKRKLDPGQAFEQPGSTPYAPRELIGPEAQKQWRRLIRILMDAGIYTDADRDALIILCNAWDRMLRADRKVEETGGEVLVGKNGGLYPNPWAATREKSQKTVRTEGARFGLAPADRQAVKGAIAGDRQMTLSEILFLDLKKDRDEPLS